MIAVDRCNFVISLSVEIQSDKYYVTFSSFDCRFGIDTDLRRSNDAII